MSKIGVIYYKDGSSERVLEYRHEPSSKYFGNEHVVVGVSGRTFRRTSIGPWEQTPESRVFDDCSKVIGEVLFFTDEKDRRSYEKTRYINRKPEEEKVYLTTNNPYNNLIENYIKYDLEQTANMYKEYNKMFATKKKLEITNVIFNDPATIVFWNDGTKTVVKAHNELFYDPEKGLAMAIAKKFFGNQGNYFNQLKKWLPEDVDESEEDYIYNPLFDELVAVAKELKSRIGDLERIQ